MPQNVASDHVQAYLHLIEKLLKKKKIEASWKWISPKYEVMGLSGINELKKKEATFEEVLFFLGVFVHQSHSHRLDMILIGWQDCFSWLLIFAYCLL